MCVPDGVFVFTRWTKHRRWMYMIVNLGNVVDISVLYVLAQGMLSIEVRWGGRGCEPGK